MADKIRFGIIGMGQIGKRHASMILNNPDAELSAICDTRRKEELGLDRITAPFYDSLEAMLASGITMDVICVASPNGLHEAHAIKAIQSGSHVVVEKPMSLTKAGCEKIIHASLQQHKLVFCVMQNRYSPPSLWLKELVDKGILGKIYLVQVNCYWNRDDRYYGQGSWHGTRELDGGTLFTQFSHFIDILYWLFGDIVNINARLKDFNHQEMTEFEDSGFVHFDFIQGGMGCLNYSTSVWDKNLESSITIIAENGSVKVGGQYMNQVEYCHIKGYEMPILPESNPPNDYGHYKGSAANHHYVFENVVKVLKGQAPITTNALEGMKVVEIIESIYRHSS
jgi:predicted dehydrogenase